MKYPISGTDPQLNFEVSPSTQRVKVSVTEILVRVSGFGGVVGVWHIWVNVCDLGKFGV
jgi:hypothetical protein